LGKQEQFEQRYRFHLNLQQLLRLVWDQKTQVEAILHFLHTNKQIQWEQVSELEDVLGQVHERVTEAYRRAYLLVLAPLKHLKAGRPLASLLPQEPDLPNLRSAGSYSELDLRPVTGFHYQLAMVVDRLSWIQVKSLAGILIVQEELAIQWSQHAETAPQHVMQPAEAQE
jgi:hypothetical protein